MKHTQKKRRNTFSQQCIVLATLLVCDLDNVLSHKMIIINLLTQYNKKGYLWQLTQSELGV